MKIEVLTERQARIVGCLALGVLPEALDDITALISDLTERLYSFPSTHDDAGAVDYEDAAIDICHECGLDDNENNIRDIVNILRKHTSEDPHHG